MIDSLSKYMSSNYYFKTFNIISVFCGLNVSSQNLCAEVLIPNVMVFGSGKAIRL